MWNVGYTSSVQGSCGVKARIVIPYASVLYRIGLIGAGTGYPLRPSTPAMRHEASLERVRVVYRHVTGTAPARSHPESGCYVPQSSGLAECSRLYYKT